MINMSAVTHSQISTSSLGGLGSAGSRSTDSGTGVGAASIWDVLEKLAKLKQEAINKADGIANTMSADDDEATKAQKQRELAKATAFIEDVQKKIEKMTEVAHTTSNSRL